MKFDLLSYLAGIASGFLLVALRKLVLQLLPRLFGYVRDRIRNYQQQSYAAVEEALKSEAYLRAQSAHIASSLFRLDEVLVPPRVIPPPKNPLNDRSLPLFSPTDTLIPFTPGYTELASQYPVTRIGLDEALENRASCILIAPPGGGKTVALASLACQLCAPVADSVRLANCLPIYLHVHDITLQNGIAADALQALQDALQTKISSVKPESLDKYLRTVQANPDRYVLLILDGMDELTPEHSRSYAKWLGELRAQIARLQILTTCNPEDTCGLLDLGFQPLGLAAWKNHEVLRFLNQWKNLWLQHVRLKDDEQASRLQYQLVVNWLQRDKGWLSPLEWTLITWAAHAGDSAGSSALHGLEAYVTRLTGKLVPRSALEKLAAAMIAGGQTALSVSAVETIFARFRPEAEAVDKTQFLQTPASHAQSPGAKKTEKRILSKERAILSLLESGLLQVFQEDHLGFKHPLVLGYLASFDEQMPALLAAAPLTWSGLQTVLRYGAAQEKFLDHLQHMLDEDSGPVYTHTLLAGRWLNTGRKNPWRDKVLERLAYLFAATDLPVFTLMQVASALLTANEPSIAVLFQQMLKSQRPPARRVAALMVAILDSENAVSRLAALLQDKDETVQQAASLAIASLEGPLARQVTDEILANAGEDQRFIVAESLAVADPQALERIHALLASKDLLVRRAGLGALARLEKEQIIPIAEQVLNDDSQWVMRNLAGQLLDTLRSPISAAAPEQRPKAGEAAWLIEYAGKIGQGISPDIIPYDVLLHAVQAGDPDQRRASMQYLLQVRDPKIITVYRSIQADPTSEVREDAAYHLWLHHTARSQQEQAL